jgi:hypothetical protein
MQISALIPMITAHIMQVEAILVSGWSLRTGLGIVWYSSDA